MDGMDDMDDVDYSNGSILSTQSTLSMSSTPISTFYWKCQAVSAIVLLKEIDR
ncbi:MAG: hypothetical protein NTW86_02945 [Candidatus Sumerlaeota bacterium]|nr:hypothetical protein [Candidatus Sumerlaeota bacterium]